MSIHLRIKELIKKEKLNIYNFERKIGASTNTISKLLREESNISGKILNSILVSFPNLSAEWLLRGEGPMFKNEPNPYKINRDEAYPNLANDKEANYLTGIDKLITHTINEILEKQKELLQKEMSDKNYHLSLKIIELLNKKLEILEDVKAGRDS